MWGGAGRAALAPTHPGCSPTHCAAPPASVPCPPALAPHPHAPTVAMWPHIGAGPPNAPSGPCHSPASTPTHPQPQPHPPKRRASPAHTHSRWGGRPWPHPGPTPTPTQDQSPAESQPRPHSLEMDGSALATMAERTEKLTLFSAMKSLGEPAGRAGRGAGQRVRAVPAAPGGCAGVGVRAPSLGRGGRGPPRGGGGVCQGRVGMSVCVACLWCCSARPLLPGGVGLARPPRGGSDNSLGSAARAPAARARSRSTAGALIVHTSLWWKVEVMVGVGVRGVGA